MASSPISGPIVSAVPNPIVNANNPNVSVSLPNPWIIITIGSIKVTEIGLQVEIELPGWEFEGPQGQKMVTSGTSRISFTRDPYFGSTTKHLDHLLVCGYTINQLDQISQLNAGVQASLNQTQQGITASAPSGTLAPHKPPQDPVVETDPGKPRRPRPKFGWRP